MPQPLPQGSPSAGCIHSHSPSPPLPFPSPCPDCLTRIYQQEGGEQQRKEKAETWRRKLRAQRNSPAAQQGSQAGTHVNPETRWPGQSLQRGAVPPWSQLSPGIKPLKSRIGSAPPAKHTHTHTHFRRLHGRRQPE